VTGYSLKIPSTGWEKVQFVYHEPTTFRQQNPGDWYPKFLKYLLNEI